MKKASNEIVHRVVGNTLRCRTCGVKVAKGVTYCDDICDKLKLTDEMVLAHTNRRCGKNWWVKAGYDRASL